MSDPRSQDRADADTTIRGSHPGPDLDREHHAHSDHKGGPLSRMMSAGILALVIVVLLLLVWIF